MTSTDKVIRLFELNISAWTDKSPGQVLEDKRKNFRSTCLVGV